MMQETPRKYTKPTYQKRPKRRPNAKWKDDVENDIRKMGIVSWRQVTQDKDGWRTANRQEVILL
jgi:hypothetical protein